MLCDSKARHFPPFNTIFSNIEFCDIELICKGSLWLWISSTVWSTLYLKINKESPLVSKFSSLEQMLLLSVWLEHLLIKIASELENKRSHSHIFVEWYQENILFCFDLSNEPKEVSGYVSEVRYNLCFHSKVQSKATNYLLYVCGTEMC